jgi:hypothetical protein
MLAKWGFAVNGDVMRRKKHDCREYLELSQNGIYTYLHTNSWQFVQKEYVVRVRNQSRFAIMGCCWPKCGLPWYGTHTFHEKWYWGTHSD